MVKATLPTGALSGANEAIAGGLEPAVKVAFVSLGPPHPMVKRIRQ